MVVRDRSKRKNNTDEVFKQAKRKGAKQGPYEARRRSRSRNFTGTGRLLTGETIECDAPQPPEEIVHNIYFWRNGFTVNDGPLRSFDDPANASFLKVKNSVLWYCAYHISALLCLILCEAPPIFSSNIYIACSPLFSIQNGTSS